MAIIKKIGATIILIGHKIKDAFFDLTKIIKLKISISAEKRKLNKFYRTMGKTYFEHYGTTVTDDSFQPIADNIQQSLNKIELLELDVRVIQNVKKCPHCGTICNFNNSFCQNCGNPFPQEQQSDNIASPESVANKDDTNALPIESEIVETSEDPETTQQQEQQFDDTVSQENEADQDDTNALPVESEIVEADEELEMIQTEEQQADDTVSQEDEANQDDTNALPFVPEIVGNCEEPEMPQPQEHKSVNKAKSLKLFSIKQNEQQEETPAVNDTEAPIDTTKKPRKSSTKKATDAKNEKE